MRGRGFLYVGWLVRSSLIMMPRRGAGAVLPRRLYVEAADSERLVERLVVMLRLGSVIFIYPVSINYLLSYKANSFT